MKLPTFSTRIYLNTLTIRKFVLVIYSELQVKNLDVKTVGGKKEYVRDLCSFTYSQVTLSLSESGISSRLLVTEIIPLDF